MAVRADGPQIVNRINLCTLWNRSELRKVMNVDQFGGLTTVDVYKQCVATRTL